MHFTLQSQLLQWQAHFTWPALNVIMVEGRKAERTHGHSDGRTVDDSWPHNQTGVRGWMDVWTAASASQNELVR